MFDARAGKQQFFTNFHAAASQEVFQERPGLLFLKTSPKKTIFHNFADLDIAGLYYTVHKHGTQNITKIVLAGGGEGTVNFRVHCKK